MFERRLIWGGAVVALLVVTAGCGGSSSDSADAEASAEVAATSAEVREPVETEPVPTESVEDEPPIVEVTASDYKFEGMPLTVPVGTRISLTSVAGGEPHELAVFREISDLRSGGEAVYWVQAYAGATDDPGLRGNGNGPTPKALTEPGHYWYVCTLPIGTTNEEFEKTRVFEGVDPSQTHIAAGMIGEFDVVADAASG